MRITSPLTKTAVGIPDPLFPRGVVLADEARRSRHRLYPVSLTYTLGSLAITAIALWRKAPPGAVAASYAAGLLAWTLVEYLFHRYGLHGIFPAGRSAWSRFLHRRLDHLHWEHHQRPWDGNHINGTLADTGPPVLVLAVLASLGGRHALVGLAGFLQAYVVEEWIHHSVHFYTFRLRVFRWLKARHLVHHSAHGKDAAFGLSSPLWDVALGTSPAPVPHVRVRSA
jgi:sterol desaturase/sphingolipid hydroxylase (fatty acid hydroxylase superfamily)